MDKLIVKWHTSLNEISENDWNNILKNSNIPFYRWNWLNQLEQSGSICRGTGWQPCHLSIWKNNKLIAIAPLYLKNHSFGEFIFDQLFIKLSQDLKIRYYPKLVGMSPLSPIEGYKFFISPKENEEELTLIMIQAIDDFANKNGILSCNFLYVDKQWCAFAENAKCKKWLNQQSFWRSSGEREFSDYLLNFNANQRRNIKRERKAIKNSGIVVSTIHGDKINQDKIELMHNFYEAHCSKWGIWGSKYLSKKFFDNLINATEKDELVIFSAHKGNKDDPIAMSLCITNMETLWGRYWGAKQDIDFLHFEVCYYSPIEWAIQKGIKEFDPGAGGNHKRRRGFIATPRISLHKWYDKRMESIMQTWLPKMNQLIEEEINTSNSEAPFKIPGKEL